MSQIERIDTVGQFLHVDRNLSVHPMAHRRGPPPRPDGLSVGFVTMERDAPHGGEMHPDGDEILVIVSGRVRVVGDSDPQHPLELGPGDAAIVRRGEWHRVQILEPTQLLHVTPGPGGEHRPLAAEAGA